MLSMIAVAPVAGRAPGVLKLMLGITCFLSLTAASLALERHPRRGRWLARTGLALAAAGLFVRIGWNPGPFLAAGVAMLLAVAAVENADLGARPVPPLGNLARRPLDLARQRLWVSGLLVTPTWFGSVVGRLAFGSHGFLVAGASLALTGLHIADWLAWRTGRPGLRLLAIFPVIIAGAGCWLAPDALGLRLLTGAGVLPLAALLIALSHHGLARRPEELLDFVIYHPARLLAATFAFLCLAGAL
ncbi:MAG TPA: hypothetical protein VM285_05460, partial [Polyangia bacterium]|nr:hypothetical protein [Polyangia bacterium]